MTRVEKFPHGAPAWADLQSPDVEASKQFYGKLLGWQYREGMTQSGARYATAIVEEAAVAAVAEQTAEAVKAGIPTMWNVYFAVDDIDAAVSKVTPAGGRVLADVEEIENFGRMAVVEDSIGAPIALVQAADRDLSTLIDEPGSPVWYELSAGNWEHGVPFYLEVLGAGKHEQDMGGDNYTMLSVGGQYVAGFSAPETVETTPHWEVYFGVADADAGAAAAQAAGGSVLMDPFEVAGVGRMALLQDPQGAQFWILQDK